MSTAAASAPVPSGISPELFTDSLFAVMNADRANYTQLIVARLGPDGAGLIKPNEHWEDMPEGAPLPAQMFRFGSEKVAEKTDKFTYQLKSLWPINTQNGPRTPMEKEGLQFVVDNPSQTFYGTEELGGVNYFTAVYADVAVSESCARCHNNHVDTHRSDFVLNDVMGGVVIRVPL
ncbi:MAG: Tll0287-like domain-containing protein, partial [Gammaproteobacteria bacterium]